MLILRHDADDETRTSVLDRVKEIVESEGGAILKVDEWGKRRFAYEIDHMTEGHYYVLQFRSTSKTLDEVTRVLGITDAAVRFMPIRLDEHQLRVPAGIATEQTTEE
ncbi:MAG: 30S ribosomal protein S6 [Thermoleophilia bacterium]